MKYIIDSKPDLFFKPDTSIWTDPYIQKNLLEAHLNPDSDAASRSPAAIDKTVSFIDGQIAPNSQLLDLGCGPGLYAKRLSARGHNVTGVDFNQTAIAYAKTYVPESQFIHANYLQNFPTGEFDAITMIYCDMGTHGDSERDNLLSHCYQALKTGGKLIFDVFSQEIVNDRQEGKSWDYSAEQGFWRASPHVVLQQTFHYPEHHAFCYQYNVLSDDESTYFLLWERYYTEGEILSVLTNLGFKHVSIEKNLLPKNNFTSSYEMFIVAEK